MAQQFVFTMQDLRRVVGDKQVLAGIHLSFLPGAKIGIIGGNGAGKSTLLRIMAGVDRDFLGDARPDPKATIGYLPQEPKLDLDRDVRGNLELGLSQMRGLLDRFEAVSARFAEPMDDDAMTALLDEQARLQDQIDACGGWEIDRIVAVAMEALRLPAPDAPVASLSGGERRRVALCRVLLEKPDLLLLDEPTNHLDAESVAWLEAHLKAYAGCVVSITHDRYFLDNVAEWILELERGAGHPFKGNYSSWLAQKQRRLAVEEKTESARQRMLKRELEWVGMSARARQAKGKARLKRAEELAAEVGGPRNLAGEITILPGPPLRGLVLEASGLCKAYGERTLIDRLAFRLPAGGIVGVIGPNGAGKTTLFDIMSGRATPDAGSLRLGDGVRIAYVDQTRDALDGDQTVFEEISGGAEVLESCGYQVQARAYCAGFNFRGTDQQRRVRNLSGGERNRVHLAKLLRHGGNLLMLDEPTNDLDVETLRSLEDALLDFSGCAVVISHDRWFLDRIATHMLAFEGDGQVTFFAGNFQDYEADRQKRLGDRKASEKSRGRPLMTAS